VTLFALVNLAVLTAFLAGPSGGALQPAPAGAVSSYPSANVELSGHGWGPGDGMGQWGALGYALQGDTYQQIIQHFYGETASGATTLGTLSASAEATNIRVSLTEDAGVDPVVLSDSPYSVAGVQVPAGQAVEMVPAATAGEWNVFEGAGCSGPWPTPVATGVSDPTAVPTLSPPLGASNASSEALQLCLTGGNLVVRGNIEAVFNSAGAARTVNILPLEQYIAGVVPNESPAGWGNLGVLGAQGEPEGFQALEAQAIAARSYAMSDLGGYGGYADVCDTTCQSYRGIANETTISDLATTDTAGNVVFLPSGAVAETVYSASTGGETDSGGTYSAVADSGDAVCVTGGCNPNHNWTAQIPVATIEADYPQIGSLTNVDVTERNGLGDMGGRVLELSLVGTTGSVQVSGDTFASQFGLLSNWFSVTSQVSGGIGGYWLAGTDGGIFSFGDASFYGSTGAMVLNKPIVGMAATPDGKGYWLVASDGGIFSFGDASFEGSLPGIGITDNAVGILPTSTGRGYLVVTSNGHAVPFGDSPQFGDPAGTVSGWNGTLVGGALTAAG
jgi:SpoIID/LytB domain protein